MVSILSTFNIGKAKGTDGVEIDIDPDALTGGVIRQVQDVSDIPVFLLTCIFTAHRNRLFARLFLDLLELKVSFTTRSMLELWLLGSQERYIIIFIYTGLSHSNLEIEIEFYKF
jgi:hypothetical protein